MTPTSSRKRRSVSVVIWVTIENEDHRKRLVRGVQDLASSLKLLGSGLATHIHGPPSPSIPEDCSLFTPYEENDE